MSAATADLVLDTRDLPRRPGSMMSRSLAAAAPAGWAISTAWIAEGSPVQIAVRLESVLDGILATGTAAMTMSCECSRCLAPIESTMQAAFQELFTYDDPHTGRRHRSEPDPGEDEQAEGVRPMDGELIDLGPVIRDVVVLDLPLAPLCRQDCAGLCAECGFVMADDPAHHHESTDPRWSQLATMLPPGGVAQTTTDDGSKGE